MIFKRKKQAESSAGALDARLYDVLKRPIITEKSAGLNEQGKVVFEVASAATKADVKAAVEALFKVEVTGVNTLNRMGKMKRFRGRPGFQASVKRAVVSLKDGQSIDFNAGVK